MHSRRNPYKLGLILLISIALSSNVQAFGLIPEELDQFLDGISERARELLSPLGGFVDYLRTNLFEFIIAYFKDLITYLKTFLELIARILYVMNILGTTFLWLVFIIFELGAIILSFSKGSGMGMFSRFFAYNIAFFTLLVKILTGVIAFLMNFMLWVPTLIGRIIKLIPGSAWVWS